jgi:hypothetical protein
MGEALFLIMTVWGMISLIGCIMRTIENGGIFYGSNKYQKIFIAILIGPAWILVLPICLIHLTIVKGKELYDLLGEL